MPIVWTGPGNRYDHIGLAVACHLCGVGVGRPCSTKTFPLTGDQKAHRQRDDLAEAFGFSVSTVATFRTASRVLNAIAMTAPEPEPRSRQSDAPADLFNVAEVAS